MLGLLLGKNAWKKIFRWLSKQSAEKTEKPLREGLDHVSDAEMERLAGDCDVLRPLLLAHDRDGVAKQGARVIGRFKV